MVCVYRKHAPDIELLPDARECLNRLAGSVAMAAITDGPSESQRAKAEALGLARWLNPILFTSELGKGLGKPHQRAFRIIEEHSGYRGRQCLYVADNPGKDFGGPVALGWSTVRVRRKGGLHREIVSPPRAVDIEVDNLRRLPTKMSVR
jgi:putative hydrolase of the HAD superfamily